MSQPQLVHLFNCDRTYNLDVVEGLLKGSKAKLGFDLVVEKHYFTLSQMSEMTTNIIPKLQMDMAFFVVHAHESRLSINEDNAGIGYAKIYRALLATAEKVIIVIGGDDNYKNKDEEDRSVISRWAWRKISSQFSEEFLDGRKGFIFSWNKEYRPIHEAALIHYLNPSESERQKFEYQPELKQVQSNELAQTPSQKTRSQTNQAMDASTGADIPKSGSHSAEERKHYSPNQPTKESSNSSSNSSASSNRNVIDPIVKNTTPLSKEREVSRPKEMQSKPKDLAILGCCVSEDSMKTVMQVFEEIAPEINLAENPLVDNLPVDGVKNYLTRNQPKFKFCVLVVDALTVKDAYESQRQQKYEELLATAADEVVAKVIVLVCESRFSSPKDEVIDHIISIVDRITKEKGFTAKLENGKLTIDPDVLVQLMVAASVASHRNPQPEPLGLKNSSTHLDPLQGNHLRNPSEYQPRHGSNETRMQQEQDVTTIPYASATSCTGYYTLNREPVMLKSQLRNGKISYLPRDLEISIPGFQVPDDMTQRLLYDYGDTIQAGVKIVRDSNGELRVIVETKSKDSSREEIIQIADNETLLLATCVRFGKVSSDKGDLRYIHPDWKIPAYVTTSLAREYGTLAKGELYVISDEKGEIKFKVEIAGKRQKVVDGTKKAWRRFKSLF